MSIGIRRGIIRTASLACPSSVRLLRPVVSGHVRRRRRRALTQLWLAKRQCMSASASRAEGERHERRRLADPSPLGRTGRVPMAWHLHRCASSVDHKGNGLVVVATSIATSVTPAARDSAGGTALRAALVATTNNACCGCRWRHTREVADPVLPHAPAAGTGGGGGGGGDDAPSHRHDRVVGKGQSHADGGSSRPRRIRSNKRQLSGRPERRQNRHILVAPAARHTRKNQGDEGRSRVSERTSEDEAPVFRIFDSYCTYRASPA
jgi:hypothetical protein